MQWGKKLKEDMGIARGGLEYMASYLRCCKWAGEQVW